MTDYKSMQARMADQGASELDVLKAVLEQKERYIAALGGRIDCLKWLIANGELKFGTLWREATQADIQLMKEKEKQT